jgi:CIC family chloride channel protein
VALDRLPGVARAAGVGAIVGLVAWFVPGIVGGGDNLIQGVLDDRFLLSQLVIILAARWLLGPFSYSAGTPGRLIASLLVIGAVSGELFADVVNILAPAPFLNGDVCTIVGMPAFFTAVVRAPLTGTLVVLGMTGSVNH